MDIHSFSKSEQLTNLRPTRTYCGTSSSIIIIILTSPGYPYDVTQHPTGILPRFRHQPTHATGLLPVQSPAWPRPVPPVARPPAASPASASPARQSGPTYDETQTAWTYSPIHLFTHTHPHTTHTQPTCNPLPPTHFHIHISIPGPRRTYAPPHSHSHSTSACPLAPIGVSRPNPTGKPHPVAFVSTRGPGP